MLKAIPLALALGLCGCGFLGNGASSPMGSPVTTSQGSTTMTPSAAQASAVQPTPTAVANANQQPNPADPGLKAANVTAGQQMEFVDLYIDQTDPTSGRTLVPYIQSKEWTLILCEMLTPTSRHWRFQRITTTDGRSLPQLDPLLMPKQN
jgi:hypothetical protein